ncbi:prepilin peptidase [Nocardioides sp.]|uniref:prepilin peptidase n=1 Tax=Nocardioides sp. TaxID=35761 RepID=UPI002637B73E|nr:prepilin peptidase [Nocardioides sp.]
MDLAGSLLSAGVGLASGLMAPRLIAGVPDIEPDPSEDPGDFPEAVPFAVLGRRPRLRARLAALGLVIGLMLGAVFGFSWGTGLFLVALPYLLALATIDYTTWFLPNRLILPACLAVAVTAIVAAIALSAPSIVGDAALGGVGLSAWYGLFWFISPRSLAFGDVKLGGLLGLVLGPFGLSATVLSVLAAGVISLLALIPMRLAGNAINQGETTGVMRAHVPFGPSMIAGAIVSVLVARALGTA